MMPPDEELDDDDELDDEDEDDDDDDDDRDEDDDDDDEEDDDLASDPDDIIDDIADAITQNMPEVVEVDIEEEAGNRGVVMTMSDESRWKLTLKRL